MSTAMPARTLPPLGGFSPALVGLELRRMVRNRRTVMFTFIMPAVLLLLFGNNAKYRGTSVGGGNITGYIMVSMAVYGAMLATTSGGAMVSVERAAGWSRQLRLTPLRPAAYIAVKLVLAMAIGLISVIVAFAVGGAIGARLLFVPVDQLGHVFATIAKFTPVYGVGEIARYPLTHDGSLWLGVLNVVVWTSVFALGAAWRFRRDTARV